MFSEGIGGILFHTPIKAYVILVYLIYTGIRATKPSTFSIYKPLFIALIFLFLALQTLLSIPFFDWIWLVAWIMGLSLGSFIGWKILSKQPIEVDKTTKNLAVSGSRVQILAYTIIFSTKYAYGFCMYQTPSLAYNLQFITMMLALFGVFSGFFLGRLFYYTHRLISK